MNPEPSVVCMRGLTVTYPASSGSGSVAALREITLDIDRGDFVAVVGRSGAGKTTMLRSITGFVRPGQGQLLVHGMDIGGARAGDLYRLRRRTATIYQHFNLVERATALQNVLCGRLGYVGTLRSLVGAFPDQDVQLAYGILTELGLAERAQQRVDRLSGGERQRVAIARALVQAPELVLADEPAASLDVSLTRLVLDTLRQWNRERGLTVIANLHNLELARTYANRIVGLRHGRVVFDGAPDELTAAAEEAVYETHGTDIPTDSTDSQEPAVTRGTAPAVS